ncbi:MAG: tRNA (pseudouridine(54)-N(1))-methyltransferase TrmY [Spirochaetaceae bacterium]|nr:MAG: tRNA (pseudouridine(54)-N(1))-methyltransferase TrmY [Spirochaetaceae bacterium]
MKVFILRARKGPASPEMVDGSFGEPDHFEIISHSIVSALFVSKDIRPDVVFHLVLESGPAAPRTVTMTSGNLMWLGGFHEKAIASVIKRALTAGARLEGDQEINVDAGLSVGRTSFERLVRRYTGLMPVFILDPDGQDLRQTEFSKDACFIFTDHIPMQKKSFHLLERLGVRGLRLGPKVLFAAHCITIVHNELDRREA